MMNDKPEKLAGMERMVITACANIVRIDLVLNDVYEAQTLADDIINILQSGTPIVLAVPKKDASCRDAG